MAGIVVRDRNATLQKRGDSSPVISPVNDCDFGREGSEVHQFRWREIKQHPKNPVPLSVPLKLRLTRISTYLDVPDRPVSYSKYWSVGL
jgi:hypothetical protein